MSGYIATKYKKNGALYPEVMLEGELSHTMEMGLACKGRKSGGGDGFETGEVNCK